MRNKLTFPSAGTETKYVWDKYSLNNNGIYKWDKHDIINETKYYWNKYNINKEIKYYWKKYSVNESIIYSMNRYNITQSSDVYGIYQRNVKEATKYLNLNNSVSKSTRAEYAYSKGTYIYFITVDGKNVRFTQADVIANPMLCNPYLYGYCGVTSSSGYKHASFYFTDQTAMKISADGAQIIFTNTYNYYANNSTSSYPKGLTDSPTGTAYIEVKLKWPDMDSRIRDFLTYPKTGPKPKTSSYIQGQAFFDFMNDGLWQNQEPVYMVDYSNSTVVTTTDIYDVKIGLDSTLSYYYEYIGEERKQEKGDFIEEIISTDNTAYPSDGIQDGYWYVETSAPSSYLWEKYTVNTLPTWGVYKASPEMMVEVEIGVQNGRNSFSIASDTDLGEPERIYPGHLTLNDVSGNEIITLYGKNDCCQLYTDLDEIDMTIEEFAQLLTHIPHKDPIYETWIRTSPVVYIPAFSIRGNTYVFRPTNTTRVTFRVGQNNDNTYTFEADASQGIYCFHYDKALSSEKNTILYGVYSNYDPPSKQYIYPVVSICMPVLGETAYNNVLRPKYDTYYASTKQEVVNNLLINNEYNLPFKILGEDGNYFYKIKDNTEPQLIEGKYYNSGVLLETITDINTDAYPQNDYKDGYWYVYEGLKKYPGDFLGVIKSETSDTYPEGISGDYWYKYKGYGPYEDISKAEYIGVVESNNKNDFPIDSYQGQYWYVYTGSQLFQYLGDYLNQIDAEMMNAYPHNGIKGKYWYVYKGYENNGPYKSKWIQQVETNEQNAYPQDGINGYYWYVYNKSYEGYKLQIEDSQIRGGIDYKHNVNPEEDYTIGCVASAEIEFDYDNRNGDVEQYLNEEYCDYYTWQPNDNDWRLVGRFYLDNVNHNRKLVNIKAFDAIGAKCEKFVDEFIANYTFPTTLRDFFGALCAELGVTGSIDTGLVNAGFSFGDNFEAINITGRQLLQYIAEMSCGFIKAKPDDTIILTTYNTKELDLTNSQYTNTSIANYSVDKVEGLTVRTTEDDYGVSAGSLEGNRYIIENNPLFYAQSDDEIQAPVNNIYNKLKAITYTPADIELLQDFGIECGDIITLNGKTFYVMEKELSASGCKLKCFGNKVRAKQESGINSDIVALRGKTNELYRDLEKTQSTLTDRANGLQSQITQTAEEISLRVTNEVAGLESKITQTADSITSTVTDQINQTKSEIKQTTDSISLQVDSQGELMAQLRLDVDGIALRGYVTFTDLAGSGTTVINGSNITTGTISADRINMKGAISWGDLDADCKDTIASYAGADGDDADVPDYIHSTYIDAVKIKSPTIQGGTLSAGTTADGYMKLSSTGLNFHSSEKAICGIGYYSGNKELPYIVLGAGVDDYGTDKGMIKKYTNGIWIGDGDGLEGNSPTGTGIFINFTTGAIQKYVNGSASAL